MFGKLKVIPPEGYVLYKDECGFIRFKKDDSVLIEWHDEDKTVEIKADGEHFFLDASRPSFSCSFDDAWRFFKSTSLELPSINELKVISKHLKKINDIISINDGFKLRSPWLWSNKMKNDSEAFAAYIYDGDAVVYYRYEEAYARGVISYCLRYQKKSSRL